MGKSISMSIWVNEEHLNKLKQKEYNDESVKRLAQDAILFAYCTLTTEYIANNQKKQFAITLQGYI